MAADQDDWRITNQRARLGGRKFVHRKWRFRSNSDHDHCEFCWAKFPMDHESGWCTPDEEHWVCDGCFDDFSETMDLRAAEDASGRPPEAEAVMPCGWPRLHEPEGFEYVGTGPDGGWAMSPDIYARCPKCGYMMSLDHRVSDGCDCGNMYKDTGACRFGAGTGDSSIKLYRRLRQSGRSAD